MSTEVDLSRRAGNQQPERSANMAGQSMKRQERQERQGQSYELAGAKGGAVKTRVAFLATLGHLHTEPLKYDLACLRSLIHQLEPDLLGVEVEPADWEHGTLSGTPVEVREALLPASAVTDTVVVPLGNSSTLQLAPPRAQGAQYVAANPDASSEGSQDLDTSKWWEWRANLLSIADRLLTGWQRDRAAQGPEAVNSRAFGHLCGLVCALEEVTASDAGRRAWEEANERILRRLIETVRRDPGRRVLVAINCRRVHWLESRLRPYAGELALVPYEQL
jgi:hypothetical protein